MQTPLNLQKIVPFLEQNDVSFAGLFGSYAFGQNTEESDVDILVRFSKTKSLFELVALERILSELLKKKVDLVTEGFLSPYIKDTVLQHVKIFYGKK